MRSFIRARGAIVRQDRVSMLYGVYTPEILPNPLKAGNIRLDFALPMDVSSISFPRIAINKHQYLSPSMRCRVDAWMWPAESQSLKPAFPSESPP